MKFPKPPSSLSFWIMLALLLIITFLEFHYFGNQVEVIREQSKGCPCDSTAKDSLSRDIEFYQQNPDGTGLKL